MTKLFHRAVRRTATIAALALVATGSALVAAPAGAASESLDYNCTSADPLFPGTYVFTAVIDTNAPGTLGSGLSTPITTTATVTAPEEVANMLRAAGVTSVGGTATATGTVDGVARQTTLTIPTTAVSASGPTTVVGSGPSGSITGGAAGTTIVLGAGGFTATMTAYNASGPVSTVTFTCALQDGQNLLVDTVSVVPAPTTVTLSVLEPPVEYGEQPTVTATVASSVSNAKPAGTVTFTWNGTTITVDVKGGKATATFPAALELGVQHVSATFTPKDPNLAPSTTTKAFRVVRDQTSTEATAVYRELRQRIVAKAKVFAEHGTEVSGSVKFVLRRNGVKIRTAIDDLNQFDRAKKVFRNIERPGHYKVVARYLGSDTLKRSVDRVRLTI